MMVGLDIDGVVADFLTAFLRFIEKKIGNGPIPQETITDFKFKEHADLTEEIVWKCMEEVSCDPLFWRDLSPMISGKDWARLEELSYRRQLVFLTHRFERETYSIHRVSQDWLRSHGIRDPIVYFTQEPKATLVNELGVSLFMDDQYENCVNVANETQALVLMPDRPYNQSCVHPRIKKVFQFNELFDHLPQTG